MEVKTRITTDHEEIKKWAEIRGGHPAVMTEEGDEPQDLKIIFADEEAELYSDISWDDFFEKFEDKNLAFVYPEEDTGSRIFHIVRREGLETGTIEPETQSEDQILEEKEKEWLINDESDSFGK